MVDRDFASFVEAQNAAGKEVDHAARVAAWLQRIEDLYDQAEKYLARFTAQGQIRLERRKVLLNEEFLGAYEAPTLLIHIGAKDVLLEPVGCYVVGAQGRVDLKGDRDVRKLVLLPQDVKRFSVRIMSEEEARAEEAPAKEEGQLVWKIVPGLRQDYLDLSEKTFTDAILAVSA